MKPTSSQSDADATAGIKVEAGRKWLASLWPQCPLAIVLILVGGLNVLDRMSLPLAAFHRVHTLNRLADSLSALGGTAQVILGLMLVVTGIGLFWRLVSAWSISVFLLAIMVVGNVAHHYWGHSLVLILLLASLLWTKSYFTRRTILASFVFSMSGIIAVLAYGVVGSYLLGKGFHPEIHDLNTAIYFTIVTLSTVGYGDIVPVTPEARWFAMSLLVIGLGVFASAIASALGPKISGELKHLFNPKEKHMKLKDHIILVGEGAIAGNTARELAQRGVPLLQIVPGKVEPTGESEHPVVEGDATDDALMRRAGIEDARMVIAACEDDGENAFIALVAKDLNPHVRVLAVASSPISIRRLKLARADIVFSPAAVGSRLLADIVEGGQISTAFGDLLEGQLHRDK